MLLLRPLPRLSTMWVRARAGGNRKRDRNVREGD
jgi:hypothetical protein